MGVKHAKVSARPDGDDEAQVRPSDWNASHVIEDDTITAAHVAAANKDGLAGVPSMRTLGVGAAQAASGDHTHGWISAEAYGAVADGVTDDTAAIEAALAAAGDGGTVWLGLGTYIVDELAFQNDRQVLHGAGWWTKLKAKAGAVRVVEMRARYHCLLANLKVDGNANASAGLRIFGVNAEGTSQNNRCERVFFSQCTVGVDITSATLEPPITGWPYDQVDKNTLAYCYWQSCGTGVWLNSINGQLLDVEHAAFDGCDLGVRATGGTLWMQHCGWQYGDAADRGIALDGQNLDHVTLKHCWFEGPGDPDNTYATNIHIHGAGGWPICGVTMEHTAIVGGSVEFSIVAGVGTAPLLDARFCRFVRTSLNADVDEAVFHDFMNSWEQDAVWNPTGVAATESHRTKTTFDGVYRYLGAALVSRVNRSGEHISLNPNLGLVLKSPNGNYWRLKIGNDGVITTTDVGNIPPEYA